MHVNLYCKSYRGDLARVKKLAKSIIDYNVDNIPFVISVPREDVSVFKSNLPQSATIIEDESITLHGNYPGWVSQQIVKSSFWKMRMCDVYVLLDSDSYFIRPFFVSDFIHPSGVPYTVMNEGKELLSWACNRQPSLGFDPQISFIECRSKIQSLFSREGRIYDFGPTPSIWACKVWESLEETYIKPNGLTFERLICSIPSEFTWYGEWLLTDQTFPIWPIEPMFKVFHYRQQYEESVRFGYTERDLAKIYSGIVMQSNWGAPVSY